MTRTADGGSKTQKLSENFKANPTTPAIHDANQDGLADLVALIPYEKVKVLLQVAGKDFEETDVAPPGGIIEQPWLASAVVDGDDVGQIFYFQSLKIQLDDEPERSDDFSPIIAEFNWHPFTRFSARTGAQFDWDTNKLEVAGFGVSYAGKHGQRASFDYRYRRERVDQFDFRAFWPVNESWRILSRVNYSFADDDLLELQGGIEYESCCWILRVLGIIP